jgi:hypothetical protein
MNTALDGRGKHVGRPADDPFHLEHLGSEGAEQLDLEKAVTMGQ